MALIAGLSIAGLGLLLFARAPVDANYWTDVFPVMLLLGLGAGTCFPSLMTLAMSGATREDAGLASGLVNTTVQVGGAIGLAVIATVATGRTENLIADGDPIAQATNSGYHLAFLIGAILIGVGVAISAVVVEAKAPAEHGAENATEHRAQAADQSDTGEPAYSEV